jgi:SPP1 family predicted phage head-tail adaptor
MDAGRLDRRIVIQRATTTANSFNEPISTWATLATVWAKAEPVSDGERQRSGETLADKKYRFTIRWSYDVSEVDPRDRVVFDGRTYDVSGVKEMGRREFIELTATARAEAP